MEDLASRITGHLNSVPHTASVNSYVIQNSRRSKEATRSSRTHTKKCINEREFAHFFRLLVVLLFDLRVVSAAKWVLSLEGTGARTQTEWRLICPWKRVSNNTTLTQTASKAFSWFCWLNKSSLDVSHYAGCVYFEIYKLQCGIIIS